MEKTGPLLACKIIHFDVVPKIRLVPGLHQKRSAVVNPYDQGARHEYHPLFESVLTCISIPFLCFSLHFRHQLKNSRVFYRKSHECNKIPTV